MDTHRSAPVRRLLLLATTVAVAACSLPDQRGTLLPTSPSEDLAEAADTGDYYYYEGRRLPLVPVPDQVIVTSSLTAPSAVAKEALRDLGVSDVWGERLQGQAGYWILRFAHRDRSAVKQIARRLRREPQFRWAAAVYRTQDSTTFIPTDRVVVQFREGTTTAQIDSINRVLGTTIERAPQPEYGYTYYWLKYPDDSDEDPLHVAAVLQESPLVEWAAPDAVSDTRSLSVPSDANFSLQYYLKNSFVLGGVPVDDNVERAWDITVGQISPTSGGLRVAVLGSGVDASHPEFTGHIVTGYDFVKNTIGGTSCSDCETSPLRTQEDLHETAVAGIIAAQHNSSGIAGVAPGVYIIPIRISRGGAFVSQSQQADAINYAWNYGGAWVMNNSWGGGSPNTAVTQAINAATTQGRGGKGTVVVFAAGNAGSRAAGSISPVFYPANLPNVLAVSAIDRYGAIADYATRGSEIDLVAPTSHYVPIRGIDPPCSRGDVVSTDLFGSGGCDNGPSGSLNYTSTFGGTSAAAPQVAGAAALVLAAHPSFT